MIVKGSGSSSDDAMTFCSFDTDSVVKRLLETEALLTNEAAKVEC